MRSRLSIQQHRSAPFQSSVTEAGVKASARVEMNNDQGVSGKQSADGDGVVSHHLSREQAPSRCVPYRPDTSSHHPLPPSLQSKQWYGIAVKANWSILGKGGLWCAPGYNLSQSWIQSCQCSEPELMLVFTIKSVILRPLKKITINLVKECDWRTCW